MSRYLIIGTTFVVPNKDVEWLEMKVNEKPQTEVAKEQSVDESAEMKPEVEEDEARCYSIEGHECQGKQKKKKKKKVQ